MPTKDLDTGAFAMLEKLIEETTRMLNAGVKNPDNSVTIPEAALKAFAAAIIDGTMLLLADTLGNIAIELRELKS